jgi:hypothetical protein
MFGRAIGFSFSLHPKNKKDKNTIVNKRLVDFMINWFLKHRIKYDLSCKKKIKRHYFVNNLQRQK